MDWIEKLTGLTPDFGGGSTEVALAIAGGLLIVAVLGLLRPRSNRARSGRL